MTKQDNTSRNILIIFLIVLVFYLLSTLSSILLPLVLAILASALFQPLITLLKKFKIPDFIILPLVSLISLSAVFFVYIVISGTASEISGEYAYMSQRLNLRLESFVGIVNSVYGKQYNVDSFMKLAGTFIDEKSISNTAGSVFSSLSSFTGSFVMFALYYVVLIAGMSHYKSYISYVGGDKSKEMIKSFEKVKTSINSYMLIKTGLSLLNGLIVYLVCLAFGLKFAIIWGFLAVFLNFIPKIGSILAVAPPILMCLIENDSFNPVILLTVILIGTDFLIGNFIEPIIMGNHMKLNTVTVIFGLVFWGYIWGIAGMLLSVPLLVILKLIFEEVPSLQVLARLMGSPEKGKNKAPVSA